MAKHKQFISIYQEKRKNEQRARILQDIIKAEPDPVRQLELIEQRIDVLRHAEVQQRVLNFINRTFGPQQFRREVR